MTSPDRDAVESALPLSWVEFHVLLALAAEPMHGYGILLETQERTGGRVTLEPGNLYRALKRMQERGWVERSQRLPDPALEDERRRYYGITELGRRVAAAETRRMEELVGAARARLAASEGT